ncbi:MAG: DUF3343 domain-containing protein [Ruminococcaceae bacterium]|nr:DUF3343 domain-containing protein [Oscillospiraceae bacterium]
MAGKDGFFIELGSITQAHKAQKILEKNGISSNVGKLPSQSRGCSYGIYVSGRKKEEVALLLRASSVKIL